MFNPGFRYWHLSNKVLAFIVLSPFSVHILTFSGIFTFFAIKYDYDAFWRESCLTNTFILCTLVTVKEGSLTVKYDLGIACYSGLNQDLLLHVEVL